MHDRDKDISKFSYTCYRALKKTLGEYDAVVECNEIAVLQLVAELANDPSQSKIKVLSKKHGIRVDSVKIDLFESRIRQYYIVSVVQQFEQFCTGFRKEWIEYHPTTQWMEKADGETRLSNICKNTGIAFEETLLDCFKYYRLVRNYMSHTDRDLDSIHRAYKKVASADQDFLKNMSLSIKPNKLNGICFDDFLILTNIVKHIAYKLCIGSKPTNQRIAEILLQIANKDNGKAYKGLKKLKNNPARYDRAMGRFIATHCGRLSCDDQCEVSVVLKGLLA